MCIHPASQQDRQPDGRVQMPTLTRCSSFFFAIALRKNIYDMIFFCFLFFHPSIIHLSIVTPALRVPRSISSFVFSGLICALSTVFAFAPLRTLIHIHRLRLPLRRLFQTNQASSSNPLIHPITCNSLLLPMSHARLLPKPMTQKFPLAPFTPQFFFVVFFPSMLMVKSIDYSSPSSSPFSIGVGRMDYRYTLKRPSCSIRHSLIS